MDDWNLLRTFAAVARGGTLSAAAEDLRTSVSTVHRQVAQLEEVLATRLFERHGRGRVLTAAGEALVARVERLQDEVVALSREVAGRDAGLSGVVHLTTTDTLAHGLLVPRLPDFRRRFPKIHLDVAVDNRQFRLGRGEADVALRPGPPPNEPDVVARHVAEVSYAFYAADLYLECNGRPRRKRDLRKHDLVGPDDSLRNVVYARIPAELGDPARRVFRSASLLAQADAVQAGVGIAALPCFLMDDRPGVQRLFAPEREGPLYVLYHADLRHVARVRAVVDFIATTTQDQADRLAGRG